MHRSLLAAACALLLAGAAHAVPVETPAGPPQGLLDLLLEDPSGEDVADFAQTNLGNEPTVPGGPEGGPGQPDLGVPPGPPPETGSPVGPPAGLPPDPAAGTPPVSLPSAVPEPGTALLLAAGLSGLAVAGRRRRTAA